MPDPDFSPHPQDAELLALDEPRLLARYAIARDTGDEALMRAVWRRLAIRSYPRIRALVRSHTYDGTTKVKEHQRDDVTQEALLRVLAMGAGHRGHTVGEFRSAIATCVFNACMDWGRRELAQDRHIAGSLDERYDESDEGSPYDRDLQHEHDVREADRRDKEERERRAEADHELLARAIAQIDNPGYRRVLELTYLDPHTGEQIADLEEISMDNVFQRRRRGKKRLEEILRDVAR